MAGNLFPSFERRRIALYEVEINLVIGGSGPPLLLLHGYPQTHAIWHRIAPVLAERFTVVAPDLRGYGDSGRPSSGEGHGPYSKRTMAQDMVSVMEALGFARFRLAGHDRGGRVAYRLALDHPERVERVALLDIIPTWEQFTRADKNAALGIFHWYFLAQPSPFPEQMIGRDPDHFLRHLLDSWSGTPGCFAPEALQEYLRCFRDPEVIRASCEDYRAGATVDFDIDAEDRSHGRRIGCPVLVLWGARGRRRNVLEIWESWADDLRGRALECGHFLPEEAPEETARELLDFFA